MTENFFNLERQEDIQVQEAQRAPIRMNPKRYTPRHIIIEMPNFKNKEKILKVAREKQIITHKGVPPIRLATDFSIETL